MSEDSANSWAMDCLYEDVDIMLIKQVVAASTKRIRFLLIRNCGDLVKTVMDIQDGIQIPAWYPSTPQRSDLAILFHND